MVIKYQDLLDSIPSFLVLLESDAQYLTLFDLEDKMPYGYFYMKYGH